MPLGGLAEVERISKVDRSASSQFLSQKILIVNLVEVW